VVELLRARTRRIEGELTEGTALLRAAADRQVDEAYLLAAQYVHDQLTTELRWLTDLIGRLERKELRWPHEDRQ
jgi:hypothetical protein